jgi:hypothetical protein
MFVQVIQGRIDDPGQLRAAMDRWREELEPGADGWLGFTGGVTDDGTVVMVARFESAEAARRNSDRPEQGAWWASLAEHLEDVTFTDYEDVRLLKDGGSDDAGFVQVMRGWSEDPDRLAELGRQDEEWLETQAPHILGITSARDSGGGGGFTQVVYFTNEEDARAWERDHPMESAADEDPAMGEMMSLMKDLHYYDLRDPLMASPR